VVTDPYTGPEPPGFDAAESAAVISRALRLPGGADLVVGSLSSLPYVVASPGRSGFFRSEPARVQLAEWRYQAVPPARLAEGHVVQGIVIAEETLGFNEAGWRVSRALRQHLLEYGPGMLDEVLAMLEGLAIACD
jgi:hypothetical protein